MLLDTNAHHTTAPVNVNLMRAGTSTADAIDASTRLTGAQENLVFSRRQGVLLPAP